MKIITEGRYNCQNILLQSRVFNFLRLNHFACIFQHLQEILDMNATALDWMMKQFPEIREREEMRKIIGRYGLSGQQQVTDRNYVSKLVQGTKSLNVHKHATQFCVTSVNKNTRPLPVVHFSPKLR